MILKRLLIFAGNLRLTKNFIGGDTPYCRVIFKNVSRFDREKGLIIRIKCEENGEYSSNMIYLYDELYRTDGGYEVHMLLTGRKELRYLTVACEDTLVENSISFANKMTPFFNVFLDDTFQSSHWGTEIYYGG